MRKFLKNYEAGFDQRDWIVTRWAEKTTSFSSKAWKVSTIGRGRS